MPKSRINSHWIHRFIKKLLWDGYAQNSIHIRKLRPLLGSESVKRFWSENMKCLPCSIIGTSYSVICFCFVIDSVASDNIFRSGSSLVNFFGCEFGLVEEI